MSSIVRDLVFISGNNKDTDVTSVQTDQTPLYFTA